MHFFLLTHTLEAKNTQNIGQQNWGQRNHHKIGQLLIWDQELQLATEETRHFGGTLRFYFFPLWKLLSRWVGRVLRLTARCWHIDKTHIPGQNTWKNTYGCWWRLLHNKPFGLLLYPVSASINLSVTQFTVWNQRWCSCGRFPFGCAMTCNRFQDTIVRNRIQINMQRWGLKSTTQIQIHQVESSLKYGHQQHPFSPTKRYGHCQTKRSAHHLGPWYTWRGRWSIEASVDMWLLCWKSKVVVKLIWNWGIY